MHGKFQNKYRIESARLQHWNYGLDAAYFITICTKDRKCYFGNIIDGAMQLSRAGIIANVFWDNIKNHAKKIELGEFVVMPNHIHGIIILDGNNPVGDDGKTDENTVETRPAVETRHALSLQTSPPPWSSPPDQSPGEKTIGQKRFQNQGKNTISSIVGSYKSAVTRHCNRLELDFAWQSRFYDHIIRDQKSFERISEYIQNNPTKWKGDKFFK